MDLFCGSPSTQRGHKIYRERSHFEHQSHYLEVKGGKLQLAFSCGTTPLICVASATQKLA